MVCPEEHELLALLAGDAVSETLRAHVAECPGCQSRVEKLRSEVAEIRLTGQVAAQSSPVSAERDCGSPSFAGLPARDASGPQATNTQTLPSMTQPWPDGDPETADLEANEPVAFEEKPIPAVIGKYLVVGKFPPSGQAEVFRVVHPELRRDLVLKLAHQPMGEDGRSDVVADGQRLAELEHPNIVRVYDLGFYEGRPFLIMEYIRGRTLTQYAREETISPRQAAALMAEIAGAVAFAHRRGIVHQDIKPGNILIDDSDRPRLIDFGLGWQQDAYSGSPAESEGGTFAYMAPEQARLDLERVRPLSDVFALGAVLYFLLTGKAPFAAATEEESWERARRCDFDRSALKKPGVSRRLEHICLQAMACEPERRHRSAARLEQSLRRFLSWRPIMIGAATATLSVLALTGVLLACFRTSSPLSTEKPTSTLPASLSTPLVADRPLRIVRLEIEHMAQLAGGQFEVRGNLGERSFAVRPGDDVTVRAELSEPAYAYLIAFRPDGVDELLDPEKPDVSPGPTREPRYPPESKTHLVYRLVDGSGLHAFAVVVSRTSLPSYQDWKKEHGNAPWQKGLLGSLGVVWSYDRRRLFPLTATDKTGERSQGATIRGGGAVIAGLGRWLQAVPGVDGVAIKAFSVPAAPRP